MTYYKIKTKEGFQVVNFTTFKKLLKQRDLSVVKYADSDDFFIIYNFNDYSRLTADSIFDTLANYHDFLQAEKKYNTHLTKLDCKFKTNEPVYLATPSSIYSAL